MDYLKVQDGLFLGDYKITGGKYFLTVSDKIYKLGKYIDKMLPIDKDIKTNDGVALVSNGSLEWYDVELDVSDIPPSILFVAINNAYSVGFSLFIPVDMSFYKFATSRVEKLNETGKLNFCGSELIDFDYLNKTGKIRAKAWNETAYREQGIWTEDWKALHPIQAIVSGCRKWMKDNEILS